MNDIITKLADENSTKLPTINEVEISNGETGASLQSTIIGIVNAVIGVLGVVAVAVIIFGGVQYMTSAGDAGKVKKAKDTILYGVIGLIVCVLAFAIVNFVIGTLLNQKAA